MECPASVVEMLGESRFTALQESLTDIRTYVASAPEEASWVRHLPITLKSSDALGGQRELIERLRNSGPDWFFVTAARSDGSRVGYASDIFHPKEPSATDIGSFLVFDLHTSLRGWTTSHIWRAADFAEVADICFVIWRVLPAAACARALLEGVAAFVIEGEDLLQEWSSFKERGVPDFPALVGFRDRFQTKLLQAQFGSRLGERSKAPAPIKRTNVMTLLEKFGKRYAFDIWTQYEWLCDAVHPSFGFGTAYVATQGIHETGATMAADLARRTDRAQTRVSKISPTVAWAAADVVVLAVRAFLEEIPRIRWLIDDLGLTTGVGDSGPRLTPGSPSRPVKGAVCPCGSGLRFEACSHKWGLPAEPPVSRSKQ